MKRAAASRFPKTITEDVVNDLVEALIAADDCKFARQFLEKRKLWSEVFVSKFEIGAIGPTLVFPQRTEDGYLTGRARVYHSTASKNEAWGWIGAGRTDTVWPWFRPVESAKLWIVEGEWDCSTGWVRLDLAEAGYHWISLTGGAGKSLQAPSIPLWMHKRRVDLCYDNDVFQRPRWKENLAPSEKARAGMAQRRRALLQTAEALKSVGCEVFIRAVPLNPLQHWGGDIRDWVDQGGRMIEEIPAYSYEDVLAADLEITECDGIDAVASATVGRTVRFKGSVMSIEDECLVVPRRAEIDCDMNMRPACADCRAPLLAPDKVLDFKDHPDVLAQALSSTNFEKFIVNNFFGKPGRCPLCRVNITEHTACCRWGAGNANESGEQEITVVSKEPPNLSGETEVQGNIYNGSNLRLLVLADRTQHVDMTKPDMVGNLLLLRELCPPHQPSVEQIDQHLKARANYISAKVTKIRGRRRLHIFADLLYHSLLWFNWDGLKRRGWLDLSVIGDTASGKTATLRNMMDWVGLGRMSICMENVSRAGLTMGAARVNGKMRQKPGLLPRMHKKLLVLDEFQAMVEDRSDSQENPMVHLQGARENGIVEGIKIYGSRRLDAAVRLMTISNWIGGRQSAFKYACEHLAALYGRPEMLRRLDLGIMVFGEPVDGLGFTEVPPWTKEAYRTLVLRAWTTPPERVVIEDDAIRHVQQINDIWRDRYSEDIALFTTAEKPMSLLRVAAAASCACLSHPERETDHVLITREHVEWARTLFEEVWRDCGYEHYSSSKMQLLGISQPFRVEKLLTAELHLYDPTEALFVLNNLFKPLSKGEIQTFTGKDGRDAEVWTNAMVRCGAYEPMSSRNGWNREWRLTPGAFAILRNLVMLASEQPEVYAARVQRLDQWLGNKTEPEMVALSMPEQAVRAAYE